MTTTQPVPMPTPPPGPATPAAPTGALDKWGQPKRPALARQRYRPNWPAITTILRRDFSATVRSKSVLLPMLIVPFILLVLLPAGLGFTASRTHGYDITKILGYLPHGLRAPIEAYPPQKQLVVLALGYLVAPLFIVVPLMVSAALSADAFAGEKERKTLESLLHLPVDDRDIFVAKVLAAFLPSVGLSWIGFVLFCIVANASAWGVMHQFFVPTGLWLVLIFWITPAVAAVGQGVMVRVSARARTTQEANQLGGTVILPLVIAAVGQTTALLLTNLVTCLSVGLVLWILGIFLNVRGAQKFRRERLAPRL